MRTRAPCRAHTPRFMTRLGQEGWEQDGLRYFFFSFLVLLLTGGEGGVEVVCVVVATFDCNLVVLPPLVANVPLTTIGPPSRLVNRFLMGNELLVINMLGLFVILGAGKDDDDEVKKLSWWLLFMSALGSVKMGISAAAACPSNSSIEVGGVTSGSVAEV